MKNKEFIKLKPGDRVRIVSEKSGAFWAINGAMDKWLGKTMTIKETDFTNTSIPTVKMLEDSDETSGLYNGWCWFPEMLECRIKSNEVKKEKKRMCNKERIIEDMVEQQEALEFTDHFNTFTLCLTVTRNSNPKNSNIITQVCYTVPKQVTLSDEMLETMTKSLISSLKNKGE